MLIKCQSEVHLHTRRSVHFHPSRFTRPSFSIFEGLLPRLVSYLPIEFAQFGSRFLPEPQRKDPGNIDGFKLLISGGSDRVSLIRLQNKVVYLSTKVCFVL